MTRIKIIMHFWFVTAVSYQLTIWRLTATMWVVPHS